MPEQPLFRIEPTLAGKRRECAAFSRSPFTNGLLIYSACALIAAGLVYAGTQKVARKSTVSGRTELSDGQLKLYSNARRTLIDLRATEGQQVAKGQLLAVLQSVQQNPGNTGDEYTGYRRLLNSLKKQAHLLAQSRKAANRSAAIEHEKLLSKQHHLENGRRSLRRSASVAKDLLALANEQRDRGMELYNTGHLSLTDLEELQRRQLQQTEAVAEHERGLIGFNEQLQALEHENKIRRQTLESGLRDIDTKLGENERERERLQMSFEQRLVAPSAGFITGILKPVGGRVTPDAPLITMVRTRSAYHAKLWASSRSAGDMQVGQQVNLMIDAFPHQKHGMLGGEITHINVSPLTPRELNAPTQGLGSAYAVTVLMDKRNPLYARLKPGMNITADIKLDDSLLVARLFEPLLRAWQRAL